MQPEKDSKKQKNILLAIDLVLLAVAVAVGGLCFWLTWSVDQIQDQGYAAKLRDMTQQRSQMETQIQNMETMIEQRDFSQDAAVKSKLQTLNASQTEVQQITAQRDELQTEYNEARKYDVIREEIAQLRTEYGQTVRQLEDKILAGESDYRICYLTFDDGPTYYTKDFLEELERLDVYATFFTIGNGVSNNTKLRDECLRGEALGGHAIANHTYTHAFSGSLYKSVSNFMDAVNKQDQVIFDATGLRTDVVRFPAGSYYAKYRKSSIEALDKEGYGWIDWRGNAFDSGTKGKTRPSSTISSTVIHQARQEKIYVVLMHDWNKNTLGALDKIVTTLKKENYLFLPLFKESSTIGTTTPRWDN